MTGRLIGVVGPSGVGKDTLMADLVDACPEFSLVRRVITRKPGLGGEDYEAVSEDEFAGLKAEGAFCMSWQAHGLHYGILDVYRHKVAKGEQLLINLSRAILLDAVAVFPSLTVLNVTASRETLMKRLQDRGRENAEDIARRLERANQPLPEGLDVITISNDGVIEDAVLEVLGRLYPVRA